MLNSEGGKFAMKEHDIVVQNGARLLERVEQVEIIYAEHAIANVGPMCVDHFVELVNQGTSHRILHIQFHLMVILTDSVASSVIRIHIAMATTTFQVERNKSFNFLESHRRLETVAATFGLYFLAGPSGPNRIAPENVQCQCLVQVVQVVANVANCGELELNGPFHSCCCC